MGARNALELVRLGRLSPRAGSAYEVVHQTPHYRLRHYGSGTETAPGAPLLLVPPLMLTAEIYDVSPDLSAVRELTKHGIDTWVADFGAPEREVGGMQRTLDDHVRGVIDAIAKVKELSGHDVHLAGYSQGGMFCYEAAAYRRSEGVASIITFGSPVDIHRNLPKISTDITARLIRAWRPFVEPPLRMIDGLPGVLTSTGFKMLSLRRELQQLAEFLALLHDRRALERREHRRRFLAGEGFVAWPGPALMKFIDEFIVHNRLLSGGFVIDGRTVALADIRSPVLYFVGSRDEIARPPSVRAIRDAVPSAELFEVPIPAGHFGLVVGTTAMRDSWPTVIEWVKWRNGIGERPRLLEPPPASIDSPEVEDLAFAELDIELFYDVAQRTVQSAWKWIGDRIEDVGDASDQVRYQLPRLLRLRRIRDETRISSGLTLERRAAKNGERTFFLYGARAVSYADANRRVDNVVRGLIECGVRPRSQVGVLMRPRPSYLSMTTALNRLGATAVLIKPGADAESLKRAIGLGQIQFLVADPDDAEVARRAFDGAVLVLGSAREGTLPADVIDMEKIDPDNVRVPEWYQPNPGRAEDVSTIIATVNRDGSRAVRITNRRWAFSAFGAAAACTLTPNDTVYCCLPLHHPTGLLVSAGGASAGGARLSLATRFAPDVFWEEVRRYGATVAFYAGEMCRELVDAPVNVGERNHPLRLLAGSGMRADVWRRLVERFGVGVLEFYASSEVSLVLANAAGEKIGSVGRPLPGSREARLAAFNLQRGDFVRDRRGRLVAARPDEPGVLLARVDPTPLMPLDDSHPRDSDSRTLPRTVYGAFEDGDTWFVTGDLLRCDADGDYWFIDRVKDLIRTEDGLVPTKPIEDALYEIADLAMCAAYGVPLSDRFEAPAVAIVPRRGARVDLDLVSEKVAAISAISARPVFVRIVDFITMTDGYRPIKGALRREGAKPDGRTFRYDDPAKRYLLL